MQSKLRHLNQIYCLMQDEGYALDFIRHATLAAEIYDGVYDLLVMWANEDDKIERAQTMEAIDDLMTDIYG